MNESRSFVSRTGCFRFLLAFFATTQLLFAVVARIDTVEDLWLIRSVDVLVGLLMGLVVVLAYREPRSKRRYLTAIMVWLLVSGLLLVWHQAQIKIRWTIPKKHVAANQVRAAQLAIDEYANDMGSLPSQREGINFLWENPGSPKWKGPYLSYDERIDPWGNSIRFEKKNGVLRVWSLGPDGQSGTDDDVSTDRN